MRRNSFNFKLFKNKNKNSLRKYKLTSNMPNISQRILVSDIIVLQWDKFAEIVDRLC